MLFVCTGFLLGDPAWSHGTDPNSAVASTISVWARGTDPNPLWGAVLHVLTSPLALAALLALVAALAGIEERLCLGVAAMAAIGAAVTALVAVLIASHFADCGSANSMGFGKVETARSGVGLCAIRDISVLWANFSQALAPVGVMFTGLTALVGWRHTRYAALGLGLLAGGVTGLAAPLDNGYWQGVLGLMACTAFIAACGLIAFRRLTSLLRLQPTVPIVRRVLGSWLVAMGLLLAVLAVRNGLNSLGWLK